MKGKLSYMAPEQLQGKSSIAGPTSLPLERAVER